MKFRSAVLVLFISLSLQAAHDSTAFAISNEAASHAIIQEVRNLADQVARALAARRFQNRSIVEILNEEWTRNLDSAVEQLRIDIPKFQEIRSSAAPAELYAKSFLESLSVAMGTNEDAGREIREVARSVQAHTDGKWWPYWGKSSVRKISKLLGDSFARMKELDQIYHFADHQSNALFDEKVFVDYPDVFTERFRNYFLETRLDLPRDLLPSLNHLSELGGVVDVEINSRLLSKSEYLAERALTQYRFTVSFPGKPELKPIETVLDFVYATTATDPQLLHRVEVPKERLTFGFKLEAAFKKSGFFVEILSAHEQVFPEKHCGTALSVPATLPSIVEKSAAVGAGM